MVYDCFPFFNEIDILTLRLNILDSVVDRFVISEATETFTGIAKPLYYEDNKELFDRFKHKIIHVIVDDTPKGDIHERDEHQKNAVARGLIGCNDDDIIIFSDLDEIPNPDKVREVINDFQKDKIYHFAQRQFYCYLNMEDISGKLLSCSGEFEGIVDPKWLGSKICTYGLKQSMNLGFWDMRFPKAKEIGIRVANGGWHFGYMGGQGESNVIKRVTYKVKSAAHQEYNSREILSDVDDKLRDGMDMFGRDAMFKRVEIDESYPEYVRQHREDYRHLILEEESELSKIIRLIKRNARKFILKLGRGINRIIRG